MTSKVKSVIKMILNWLEYLLNDNSVFVGNPKDSFISVFDELFCKEYVAISHIINTNDGVKITLHECKHKNMTTKGVVLMTHALWFSSIDFILLGKKSIVYDLMNKGYVVWLLNNRGNEFTKFDANKVELTVEDMAKYDLVAGIDYIVRYYKDMNTKMIHIGVSQGSLQFMILMANNTEYQKYFSKTIWIAPPIKIRFNFITNLLVNLVLYSFYDGISAWIIWILTHCLPFFMAYFFANLGFMVSGLKTTLLSYDKVTQLRLKYLPSGIFGIQNIKLYHTLSNQNELPFDMRKIKLKVNIILAEKDNCVDTESCKIAFNKYLLNKTNKMTVIPNISHIDLIWDSNLYKIIDIS